MRQLFSDLRQAILEQNRHGELPDFIVPLLLQVADNPEQFNEQQAELIQLLLDEVREYETFSNVCCEKIGFSLEDIHTTLDKLGVGY